VKLPACLPASDPRTQLEMIPWLTMSGNSHEMSDKFRETSAALGSGMKMLSRAFGLRNDEPLAVKLAQMLMTLEPEERAVSFRNLVTFLFQASGTSDNAIKCQFPIELNMSGLTGAKEIIRLNRLSIESPSLRTIGSESVSKAVTATKFEPQSQLELLRAYFDCILSRGNQRRIEQVASALGELTSTELDAVTEILALGVIRGSATASGGHDPEEALRQLLESWGLRRGVEFNTSDVGIAEVQRLFPESSKQAVQRRVGEKSRAFDFVIPYRVPNRKPMIFVQGQFYAGDSGSVSHKNVDQTPTGRQRVLEMNSGALFGEFLDGAGYVTALSGDASKLLKMSTTAALIQLRSARTRLRELLQRAGVATPLEVVHAACVCGPTVNCIEEELAKTYEEDEVRRALKSAEEQRWIVRTGKAVSVAESVYDVCHRYAVLDAVAITANNDQSARIEEGLVVAGYGLESRGVADEAVTEYLMTAFSKSDLAVTQLGIEKTIDHLIADGWVLRSSGGGK